MLATSPVKLGLSALGFDIATIRQSFHLMFVLIRSLKYLEMYGGRTASFNTFCIMWSLSLRLCDLILIPQFLHGFTESWHTIQSRDQEDWAKLVSLAIFPLRCAMLLGAACCLLSFLLRAVHGQKGIGSLNDPCDCMQHHDFWVASRRGLMDIFWKPDYPLRVLDPKDHVHYSTRRQSCLYSPENEESHRPTALSDCIPGFILVHIVCMQRHLANGNPERAMDFATELVRLLPFGASCIDKSGWPIASAQIWAYYRRFRRAFAAGPWATSAQRKMDAFERGDYAMQREKLDSGSLQNEWPDWLLKEMLWQAMARGSWCIKEDV